MAGELAARRIQNRLGFFPGQRWSFAQFAGQAVNRIPLDEDEITRTLAKVAHMPPNLTPAPAGVHRD